MHTTCLPASTAVASTAPGSVDRWALLLNEASNKPTKRTLGRLCAVPAVTGLVSMIVLIVLAPPFVCGGHSDARFLRVLLWGASAAAATALLTAQGAFTKLTK